MLTCAFRTQIACHVENTSSVPELPIGKLDAARDMDDD